MDLAVLNNKALIWNAWRKDGFSFNSITPERGPCNVLKWPWPYCRAINGQSVGSLQLSSKAKSQKQDFQAPVYLGSQEVQTSESMEKRIRELEDENKRLVARITELEDSLVERTPEKEIVKSGAPLKILDASNGTHALDHEVIFIDTNTLVKLRNVEDIVWPSPSDGIPFWERTNVSYMSDDESGSALKSSHKADPDTLFIIHVTSEMAPVAKVGGLGDVVTGLGRACILRGHNVKVMLPFYECISEDQITDLTLVTSYTSYHRGDWVPVKMFEGKVSGIPVLLVQPNNHFFKGSGIYGGNYNELEAYLFFSRACLEWMQITNTQPDIIHAHEWQTSCLPLLYWDMYHHLAIKKPRIVLTIHNMEHYGECRVEQLDMCGLDGISYCTSEKAIDDRTIGHNPERLSLLKGGIIYSNAVTTVSPTYAKETMCSGWLANTLMTHTEKYKGILNGIDTALWDPSKDAHLPARFNVEDLGGKHICKHYVQRGLGLDCDETESRQESMITSRAPMVVCIGRLVAQKGIHLIRYAISCVEKMGGQFVLLGTAPDRRVQAEFEQLANKYKDNKKVRLLVTYSEKLAHMLYAAADIVLVPSMFEPCGLTQMIGMRYGAIPIVRKTGGLADTVFDMDDQSCSGKANGFVFQGIDEGSLNGALERAFKYYRNPELWKELATLVMKIDNSWDKSAGQYVDLYNSVRVRW